GRSAGRCRYFSRFLSGTPAACDGSRGAVVTARGKNGREALIPIRFCGGLRHELDHALQESGRPLRPAPAYLPETTPGGDETVGGSTGGTRLDGRGRYSRRGPGYRLGAGAGQLPYAQRAPR